MLWGQRPFRGPDSTHLAAAIRAGQIAAPPARPRVPLSVRAVLRRGLSVDPEQRFESMSALLRAMRRAVYWPRRVAWTVLPATTAVALTVAAWPSAPAAADYCEQQERRLDELWSPSRQAAIEHAFAATARAYALDSWPRVREHLDQFASQWRQAQQEACEDEAQGEPVGGRMLCLHRRFEELRRLVDLFEQADANVVEHAVEATQALHSQPACTDDEGPAPPPDPQIREQFEQLEGLLAQALVAKGLGRSEEARQLAESAVEQAKSLGLRWQQAEAELAMAVAADDDGDPQPAQQAFQSAFSSGLAAGHDVVVARAAMGVAGLSARTGEFDEADRWMDLAEAATLRGGDRDDSLPAVLKNNRGRVEFHRGQFERALTYFREGLALDEAAGRGDAPQQSSIYLNVGLALSSLGQYDEALASLEDALARERYHYGDRHPRVVRVLNSLCHVRSYAGQVDAALEACDEGIAITTDSGSDDDPKLVHLHTNLGSVLFRAGRYPQTERAYLRALELAIQTHGEGDPMVGRILNNLGVLYTDTGELDKAQDYYGRALTLFDATLGPEHPSTGILRTNLAMVYSNDGEFDRAEPLLRQSIEVLEATLGPDHVDLALSLAELGRLHARQEQHALAIPLFERAMTLREAAGGEPIELADTKYGLAMSVWEQGEGTRARALVGEARALYEQAGGERLSRLEELDAWLASHRE
ncbi:MAG: tetratricopeptide repeat-containing protein kinase family protein [Myxococcota bacterium]